MRRRGIGRGLVEAAERWAISEGCRQMASDAELWNTVSHPAHGALGYEETERLVMFKKDLGRIRVSATANHPGTSGRYGQSGENGEGAKLCDEGRGNNTGRRFASQARLMEPALVIFTDNYSITKSAADITTVEGPEGKHSHDPTTSRDRIAPKNYFCTSKKYNF